MSKSLIKITYIKITYKERCKQNDSGYSYIVCAIKYKKINILLSPFFYSKNILKVLLLLELLCKESWIYTENFEKYLYNK